MARPRMKDRTKVRNHPIVFKVSPEELGLLKLAVDLAKKDIRKLTRQDVRVTMGAYLRSLVLNDFEARGLAKGPAERK